MILFKHEITNEIMELKKINGTVFVGYLLDSNNERICNGLNVKGEPHFQIQICKLESMIAFKSQTY